MKELMATVRVPRRYVKPRVRWRWREKPLRVPTHQAAELAILGALLLDETAWKDVRGKLNPDEFSLESHRLIFHRMAELFEAGRAVDIVTLVNVMMAQGKTAYFPTELEHVGGAAYLASITEGLPRRFAVGEYVAIVKEKAKLRRIMQTCERAIEKCGAQGESAESIVKEMGKSLRGMTSK